MGPLGDRMSSTRKWDYIMYFLVGRWPGDVDSNCRSLAWLSGRPWLASLVTFKLVPSSLSLLPSYYTVLRVLFKQTHTINQTSNRNTRIKRPTVRAPR